MQQLVFGKSSFFSARSVEKDHKNFTDAFHKISCFAIVTLDSLNNGKTCAGEEFNESNASRTIYEVML